MFLPHQKAAINKLTGLKCGALFMEMGTGKTRCFTEIGLRKLKEGKASHIIILAPVCAMHHIWDEIYNTFGITPTIHNRLYNQPITKINLIGIESVSSSITAANRLRDLVVQSVMIIDESHMVKNKDARRTRLVLEVSKLANYRYISTGTPIPNGIEDIWTQCQIMSPLVLGYAKYADFCRTHLEYSGEWWGLNGGKVVARYNTGIISNKLAPYCFEIKKTDCIDLPPKTYSYLTSEPDENLNELYNATKKQILLGKTAFDTDDATIYKLFTSLQQVNSGIIPKFMYEFVKENNLTIQNPKIASLQNALNSISHAKTVIWCRYIKEIDQIADFLSKNNISFSKIDGRLLHKHRQEQLDQFTHNHNILLCTTACGGQSINLGFADYAIYMSNSFDYQVRAQSEDRIHRIGMSNKAHIIDILTNTGIDKKIHRSLKNKENAAQRFASELRALRSIQQIDKANEILEAI